MSSVRISTATINMLDKFKTDMRSFLCDRIKSHRAMHKDEPYPDSLDIIATRDVSTPESRIAEVHELFRQIVASGGE